MNFSMAPPFYALSSHGAASTQMVVRRYSRIIGGQAKIAAGVHQHSARSASIPFLR
jgi:hypothetical protein